MEFKNRKRYTDDDSLERGSNDRRPLVVRPRVNTTVQPQGNSNSNSKHQTTPTAAHNPNTNTANQPDKAPQIHTTRPAVTRAKHRKRQTNNNTKRTGITVIVVLLMAGTYFVASSLLTTPGSSDSYNQSVTEPLYKTVIPDGKTIDQLGGWKRVSPPGADPVFSFTDTVGDIRINVSQQQFGSDVDVTKQAAEIAKQFNATEKLETRYAVAYIGTSAKGPQSVIFAKNKLLIMIQSASKIDNEIWGKYIDSLNFNSPINQVQF